MVFIGKFSQTLISVDLPDLSIAMNTAPCNDPVDGSVNPSKMQSRESMAPIELS